MGMEQSLFAKTSFSIHETTHTLQAADSALGLYTFGPYYLIDTFRFGYEGSIPEIEGYAMQASVRDLLILYPNLTTDILNGNPPVTAATDLAALYKQHEAALRVQFKR